MTVSRYAISAALLTILATAISFCAIGYIEGTVYGTDGNPLSGAKITVEGEDIISISDGTGHYKAVAQVGTASLTATNITTGDKGTGTAEVTYNGRTPLDIYIRTTAPEVISTEPPTGAAGIGTYNDITVTFTEPVSQTSITSGSFKVTAGAISLPAISIAAIGNDIRFRPVELPANSVITVTVTTDIKDLQGNNMESGYTFSFRTKDTEPPLADTGQIIRKMPLLEADEHCNAGEVKIIGGAGAVEGDALVVAHNCPNR